VRDEIHQKQVSDTATLVLDAPTQLWQERVRKTAQWIIAGVILANAFGLALVWGVHVYNTSHYASQDLPIRMAAIEALLQQPDYWTPPHLAQLQANVNAAVTDLAELDSIIPLHGAVGSSQIRRLHLALVMGSDFMQAVQGLVGTLIIIEPHLQTLVFSLFGDDLLMPPIAPLNYDDIHQAQRLLQAAFASWNAAQSAQQALGTQPIAGALGIQSTGLNVLAHFITPFGERFSATFPALSAAVDNLHVLLGVAYPSNIFVALLDPDQLRPIGGAIGSYALTQNVGGVATGALQFSDVTTIDCPHACIHHPLPPQYAWYSPPGGIWGLRDAGLDPDFSASARNMFNLIDSDIGETMDGILLITPAVLQSILAVMGPVTIPSLHVTVNAGNLVATMYQTHQMELARGTAKPPAAIPTGDERFANAVFGTLANATTDQLQRIGAAWMHDLLTKDLQLYTVYQRVLTQAQNFGVDGIVGSPGDDSLTVMDTNLGQDYASNTIAEHVADHITLDPSGITRHTLTITYSAAGSNTYADLVQVVIPSSATAASIGGQCQPVAVTVTDQRALACRVQVIPGAATVIHAAWTTSFAFQQQTYHLIIHRQAGANQSVAITIATASGAALSTTTPGARVMHGSVIWAVTPLTSDVALSATLT
jgi:hypothetical protein